MSGLSCVYETHPVVVGVKRVGRARSPSLSRAEVVCPPDQRIGYVYDRLTGDGEVI